MTRHIKYHKIHTSLPDKICKHYDNKKDIQWCVTEKVHGANFSIYIYKSGEICCGKRTGFIEEGDSFFGYFSVVDKMRQQLYELSEELFTLYPSADHEENGHIVLFGELFGGFYPGLSPTSADVKPVQTGVWYSPQLEFMLFDICVAMTENVVMHFLPFDEAITLANKYGVFCAEPLRIGSLTDCVGNFDINFPSTIPERLGLPDIPLLARDHDTNLNCSKKKKKDSCDAHNNHAEGVVIRIFNGPPIATTEASSRPIMKLKTKTFEDGEGCPSSVLSGQQKHIKEWILSLIDDEDENNYVEKFLDSACSKVGSRDERRNWPGIVDCILDDVQEQCGDDSVCNEVYMKVQNEIKCKLYNYLVKLALHNSSL